MTGLMHVGLATLVMAALAMVLGSVVAAEVAGALGEVAGLLEGGAIR